MDSLKLVRCFFYDTFMILLLFFTRILRGATETWVTLDPQGGSFSLEKKNPRRWWCKMLPFEDKWSISDKFDLLFSLVRRSCTSHDVRRRQPEDRVYKVSGGGVMWSIKCDGLKKQRGLYCPCSVTWRLAHDNFQTCVRANVSSLMERVDVVPKFPLVGILIKLLLTYEMLTILSILELKIKKHSFVF